MSDSVKRLPVFHTVGESLKYTFRNWILMIQLIWVWVGLIALFSVFAYFTGGESAIRRFYLGVEAPNETFGGYNLFLYIALLLLMLAASYSVIVGWHRALLLNEQPDSVHVKVGNRELQYFLRTLGLTFLFLVPAIVLMLMATVSIGLIERQLPGAAAAGIAATIICAVFLIVFFSRFTLIFPGAAVGDRRVTFRSSLQLTRKNGRYIFAGFCLITLFQIVISIPVYGVFSWAAFGGFGEMFAAFGQAAAGGAVQPQLIAMIALNQILTLLFLFCSLSFMSYCYWFLVPPPEEGDLAT